MSFPGHRVGKAPFACADGRVFDVIDIVVEEGGSAPFARRCTIDIQQRDCDEQYPEFVFLIFKGALERGVCGSGAPEIVDYALNWIVIWLEEHAIVPYAHREGRPMMIECR